MRETLKASYSHMGRPSIDPEVLVRILLIGYLYGITSERRLVEDVGMHLAYRWFTGLGLDQEVPHHSTFSKNRHGRFHESPLFLELFERIVRQCVNVGLLKGLDLSVDSTQTRADASPDRTITREQLPEVAKVNRTVREYVEQIERENILLEPAHTSDPSPEAADEPKLRRTYRNSPPLKISTIDPESALSSKRGASEFAYYDNYLIDSRSCVIAGVMTTPARLSQEIVAARQIASYIPVLDRKQQTKGFYTQHEFTPVPEQNSAKPSQGRNCSQKAACTPSPQRMLKINWYEDVRELSGSSIKRRSLPWHGALETR